MYAKHKKLLLGLTHIVSGLTRFYNPLVTPMRSLWRPSILFQIVEEEREERRKKPVAAFTGPKIARRDWSIYLIP